MTVLALCQDCRFATCMHSSCIVLWNRTIPQQSCLRTQPSWEPRAALLTGGLLCVGQAVPAGLWAPASCRRLPAAAPAAPGRLLGGGVSAALAHRSSGRNAARMRWRAFAHGHAELQLHAAGHGHAGGPPRAHGQPGVREHGHEQAPSVELRAQEGSAERYLTDVCGVPESAADSVIQRAVTWRVTAAGRPLIDRRHRSKVERNMPIVAAYLTDVCGIAPGTALLTDQQLSVRPMPCERECHGCIMMPFE